VPVLASVAGTLHMESASYIQLPSLLNLGTLEVVGVSSLDAPFLSTVSQALNLSFAPGSSATDVRIPSLSSMPNATVSCVRSACSVQTAFPTVISGDAHVEVRLAMVVFERGRGG
jgi:hypothetical protein